MKIAYVVARSDAVGGASIHVRDLGREMRARGHEVLVLVGGTGPVTDLLAAAGVPFRPLDYLRRAIRPVNDARALFELMAALGEFAPDVVSLHAAKAGWLGRVACARLGLPAIYTPHGLSVGERAAQPQRTVWRLAEMAVGRWTDAMVCVCEHERQLALRNRIAPPEKLHVILNGVHDVAFNLRATPAAQPARIVSVARFEAPKDHRTLLLALSRLDFPDWQLDLVGDGPLENESRALASSLGIGGRVRFLGYQEDAAPVLARAGMFVLSSRSEALPRSILEALRAGLPVIASDVGGVRETVDNEVNGLLVPSNDPAALSAAVDSLCRDPAVRERCGKASRAAYESHFRFEHMAGRTLGLYEFVGRHSTGS